MSLVNVRPFFKNILDRLDLTEHQDAFNVENIASSQIDMGYHIALGLVSPIKQFAGLAELNVETTVRVFLHGYANPYSTINKALELESEIIKKCLNVECGGIPNIKLVTLVSSNREPLAPSNDNIIMSTMIFNTLVMVQPI